VKGEAIGNQEKKTHMQKRAHHEVSDEMHNETKGTKTLNPKKNWNLEIFKNTC
jgi:hypothetical protein